MVVLAHNNLWKPVTSIPKPPFRKCWKLSMVSHHHGALCQSVTKTFCTTLELHGKYETLLTGSLEWNRLLFCQDIGFGVYLPRILLTHPWLTRSWREMSQGRTPWWASSTIRCLTTSGRGLPLTNTPPSWFTPPCPARQRKGSEQDQGWMKEGGTWLPSSDHWEI